MRWWLVSLAGSAAFVGCALAIGLGLPWQLGVALFACGAFLAAIRPREMTPFAVVLVVLGAAVIYGSLRFNAARADLPAGPVVVEGRVQSNQPVGDRIAAR